MTKAIMSIVITGSIAYDYIMSFPGRFKEHILPAKIANLSVSFLVDSMIRQRGGCAPNIAYSLALLGERAQVMGTAGQDFADYRAWLEAQGVDTSGIVTIKDDFTASFFVSTDLDSNQIASFYTGAMSKANTLSFADLDEDIDLAVISPNDPQAMVKYARECQELGIPYIYDPSQQIIRLSAEELIEGAKGSKVLIVNGYELSMISEKTGLDSEEIAALTETLIVTKGENGSTIRTADAGCDYRVFIDIPPAKAQHVADPTGVGDAYRAGIIKGMLHGCSWETTGRLGSLAAVYVVEQRGTQNHRYTLPEFVARYRENFGDTPELAGWVSAPDGL